MSVLSLAYFSVRLFIFSLQICRKYLHILATLLWQFYVLQRFSPSLVFVFSLSLKCVFCLFGWLVGCFWPCRGSGSMEYQPLDHQGSPKVCFDKQVHFKVVSNISIFLFGKYFFNPKKFLSPPKLERYSPTFSSKYFNLCFLYLRI